MPANHRNGRRSTVPKCEPVSTVRHDLEALCGDDAVDVGDLFSYPLVGLVASTSLILETTGNLFELDPFLAELLVTPGCKLRVA